ncbi:MAG TPA: redox-regulated ATPase YchF [Anaerolineales bacterium]|nr:redox-regulated ATPase YchF [Anaerolineales bacterium]
MSRARLPVPPLRLIDFLDCGYSISKDRQQVKDQKGQFSLSGDYLPVIKYSFMRLGIIGLSQSGKTTVFNALTRGDQPITVSGGRFDVHTAVVDVPDERVDRLSKMFEPGKTAYAKVTYADIAGLEGNANKSGLSGALLNQLTQMDGFVHVVRCFENQNVPHPIGTVDPQRDIAMMDAELLINDLISVERKLERLAEERKKGAGRDKAQIEREISLFERLKAVLTQETPLREIDLSPEEEKLLSGFGFLSRKPVLLLLNVSDDQTAPQIPYPYRRSVVVPLQGKLEMELAQLDPEDAAIFMEEYKIETLGLYRVISLSYELLGLISFFTVGKDEVRAWTVHHGAFAPEAAGVIHSDLQKGFIRAEVVSYQDLLDLGGLAEARSKGKLRLEGKDYQVQDGEIMHVRFNL